MSNERSTGRRRCPAEGCTTILSSYNSDYLCFAHADERTRARFERPRPAPDRLALYRFAREPQGHPTASSA
jgi:hypothetical protein